MTPLDSTTCIVSGHGRTPVKHWTETCQPYTQMPIFINEFGGPDVYGWGDGVGDACGANGKAAMYGGTVDYIKMHYVCMHKIGSASDFPGTELGPTQNCSSVHNAKCKLLWRNLCIMSIEHYQLNGLG